LVAAARVAYTFKLDPVAVLKEPRSFDAALRDAAHNSVRRELAQASKNAQQSQGRG
jgi:hypothetical protein